MSGGPVEVRELEERHKQDLRMLFQASQRLSNFHKALKEIHDLCLASSIGRYTQAEVINLCGNLARDALSEKEDSPAEPGAYDQTR